VSTGGSGNGTGGGTANSGGVQGSGATSASGGRSGSGGAEASGSGGERSPAGSGGVGVGASEVTGEINCAVAGNGAASSPGGGTWLTSLVVGLAIRSRRRRR
jgi:MYXO-CTERM domain-containing protein